MTEKERLKYVAEMARTIQEMSRRPSRLILWCEQINRFSECVVLVATMPDMFVDTNVNQINQALIEARIIFKELCDG